jgi:hypothetical protein
MAINGLPGVTAVGLLVGLALLAGCAAVKEKTAPCKRPAELTPYAGDARHRCGPMVGVNDPAAAFAALGLE